MLARLLLAAAFASPLLLASACRDDPYAASPYIAPFTTTDLAGAAVEYPAVAGGKPSVLRFWADTCGFCEPEMSMMQGLVDKGETSGVELIAVNAGQSQEVAAAFTKRLGLTYRIVLDPDSAISRQYGVVGLPTTFFVGADGRVHTKLVGEATEAMYRAQIDALRGKK